MKMVIVGTCIVIFLVVVIFIWGNTLPTTHQVSTSKAIAVPVSKVWETMSDWEGQVQWRKDVKSVEIVSANKFIETPSSGPAVEFEVVRLERNSIIELKMSGPFEGEYLAEFSETDGITTIQISETIVQESHVGRIVSALFFDLNDFVDRYFEQLEKYLKE
ncbi:SRPBCC family protein [Glaciecola siphonariae]|uniref:SRPBCC family protein n=1 Tax=Glaciecola siphonariae TaxID=521012 RepID=A0ABV9LR79_9ALTE